MLITVVLIFAAAFILGLLYFSFKTRLIREKRKTLKGESFPDEWRKIVEKNVEIYNHLPEKLKNELHGLVRIFIAEKNFEGCNGLEITDEIRVSIAAQASILLLNRKTNYYPKLYTIAVYPGAYMAKSHKNMGGNVHIEEPSVRLGESWMNGKMVLAWDHVKQGPLYYKNGHNLVMHEFAHQLDQEDGVSDGAPILNDTNGYGAWSEVFSDEYGTLRKKVSKNMKTVMDDYGATNPAEFFAVATETFFEKPQQLKKKHPELYIELQKYYRLNPVEWF